MVAPLNNDGPRSSWPPRASLAESGAALAPALGEASAAAATADRAAVLDEAYQEYCRLGVAGEAPDLDALCARFPGVKSALVRLLSAHRFLEANLHLVERPVPARWPEPGQEFLGFLLLRELGRGALARVFLATETALGDRLVALKVSCAGAAEAQTLGRLEHPNVVPVHSVHEDPASGLTAVCMPYLGTATLCDVLDRAFVGPGPPARAGLILLAARDAEAPDPGGRQAPARVLRRGTYIDGVLHLAAQLADGLAFIHARAICHRDLKPSNVLLSPDGRPLLLDFNLCANPLAAARLGGTPPYTAPEQLRALAADPGQDLPAPDARSDLYSLGVILYELLTGEYPVGPLPQSLGPAELFQDLLERQRAGPRPLRQANPNVDQRLARLVERCLAYDPQDRPASAAALAADLRKCLSPLWRGRRWAGRHRRSVFAAVLAGLLILLAAGCLWSMRDPYAIRQLNQGLDNYRQGEYGRAVEHFTAALREDPRLARALFARGRAYQRQGTPDRGNFGLALADYRRAEQLTPDGKIRACMAYCSNHMDAPRAAVLDYEKAIAAGFRPAAVFNNLGYTYLELGKLKKAQETLDQAVALNPALQAAYHNRALAFLRLALPLRGALRSSRPPGGGQARSARTGGARQEEASRKLTECLKRGRSDIRKAIELGPVTAPLYYDAACLSALGPERHDLTASALHYLEQAVAHGYNPQGLAADPLLAGLKQEPRFQALIRLSPLAHPPQQASRLIDPLQGLSD